MHEPEGDVGHRRPVGDCDRERVVRGRALGVQRAVDRVDDHPHVIGSEVDLTALLGHRAEPVTLLGELGQLRKHDVFGGGVEQQRAVAAAAAGARLPDPFGGRRRLGQHALQPLHGSPADGQPVDPQGCVCGGHRLPMLSDGERGVPTPRFRRAPRAAR